MNNTRSLLQLLSLSALVTVSSLFSSDQPTFSEWMKCTRQASLANGNASLGIDNACMKKQFAEIGRGILAEKSIQKSLIRAGINPKTVSFRYNNCDGYLKSSFDKKIICGSNKIVDLYNAALTPDEAVKQLRVGIRHELGHLAHNDHRVAFLAQKCLEVDLKNSSDQHGLGAFVKQNPGYLQPFAQLISGNLSYTDFHRNNIEAHADAFALSHTKDPKELAANSKYYANQTGPSYDTHPTHEQRARLFAGVGEIRAAQPISLMGQFKKFITNFNKKS